MKTIFKNGSYERVSNEIAKREVKFKRATYASKSEWKSSTRSIKSENQEVIQSKDNQAKSKKAERSSKLKIN
jgi:hypothetical protein